jgi:predicted TIM-barrel fold metal-dependent hydrolase
MGYGYYPELLSLAQHRPNLYADLAAWQPLARDNYIEFARVVKTAVSMIGADRVLFATDSSFTWLLLSEAEYVAKFKALATSPRRHPSHSG